MSMTREEILAMQPGRELDALIAEKVMGWHGPIQWVDDEDGSDPFLLEPGVEIPEGADEDWVGDNNCIMPHYSTTWAAAGEVIEKMQELGFDFFALLVEGDKIQAMFRKWAEGSSTLEAIAKAALLAVMDL